MASRIKDNRSVVFPVLVAALGYFVDIYDLILFLIVRVTSLRGIGVPPDALQYAVLRLLAGIGLAGELGAGVTLVSEIMSRESRGWGTTLVAGIGLLGAIVASLVGAAFSWRVAYFVGGGLGLGLLFLRVGLYESGMFEGAKEKSADRGNFFRLFATLPAARKYVSIILVGMPIWFVLSILVGFSPEMAKAMGLGQVVDPGRAVLIFYVGASSGDFASGFLSQLARSRKKVLALFLFLTALSIVCYFTIGRTSLTALYACCGMLGGATGYWAVFVTVASEQFGTNLRATATTTVPNFVRGAVVPMTAVSQALEGPLGVTGSAAAVGSATLIFGAIALFLLDETFGRDLDFVES